MAKTNGGIRYSHSAPSDDYKEFRAFSREWEKTYFDYQTGGYVVTNKERIESAEVSNNEREKFQKEQPMAKDLAQQGHKVEHLSDKNRTKGQTYDVNLDGEATDFKSTNGAGNIQSYAKHAIKDQGANTVVFRLESHKPKMKKALQDAKRHSGGRILYYYSDDKTLREV